MKDNKDKNNVQEAELSNTIDPEMIVMDDDSAMPEPETKSYGDLIRCTPKFMKLFNDVVGHLPYASILSNSNGDQIKLIDMVKYVEARKDSFPASEMDKIISFISNLEFKYARPLMEVIENKEGQRTLYEKV